MISMLNIYPILLNFPGKLAIISRPRGNEILEESIEFLKSIEVNLVVSALTKEEEFELGLNKEKEVCEKYRIDFLQFRIEDRGVPANVSLFQSFCKDLALKIQEGKSIGIHCRAGIGRSSLIAASVMIHLGFTSSNALSIISESRNLKVPDTIEQEKWVGEYYKSAIGKVSEML